MHEHYQDKHLRYIGIPLAGILYRHFGEPEPLFNLLSSPLYYYDLLICIFATLIVWNYNRWLIIRLDKQLSWTDHLSKRILVQFLYGHIVSAIFVITVDFVYHRLVIGRADIRQLTKIISFDLSAILLIVSLLQLGYAFINIRKELIATLSNPAKPEVKTILAQYGKTRIPVAIENIACFEKSGNLTILRTLDGKEYIVDYTLENLQEILSETQFYRVNRQVLSSAWAISSIENNSSGKLLLNIASNNYWVSKTKAVDFMRWMGK